MGEVGRGEGLAVATGLYSLVVVAGIRLCDDDVAYIQYLLLVGQNVGRCAVSSAKKKPVK
jgi:hypothetical protein